MKPMLTRRKIRIRRLRKRNVPLNTIRVCLLRWPLHVLGLARYVALSSFLIFMSLSNTCAATSIKWTPADETKNGDNKPNAAATAPKSQRYWDEHGIERPDYAKTDAEVARERAAKYKDGIKSATETLGGKLIIGVTIVALSYLYLVRAGKIVAFWDKGSFRLGGSSNQGRSGYASSFASSPTASREEARNARLARFDKKQE